MWCDAGYQGVHKRTENLGREVDWQVAMRPGKRRTLGTGSPEYWAEEGEGVGKGQGGASLPEGEADIRLWESALPGIGEEHAATGIVAGAGQPDDSGESTGGLTWRQAGPNPPAGRLRARHSPAGGEITERNPSVVPAGDASHIRIPAQGPRDRQSRPLFRVSLGSDCRTRNATEKSGGVGVAGGMSKMAKRELLATIRDRYRASSKNDKTRILDEFMAVNRPSSQARHSSGGKVHCVANVHLAPRPILGIRARCSSEPIPKSRFGLV